MSYCTKCGRELNSTDPFCPGCGTRTPESAPKSTRTETFDGKIHKCPNCGEVLESFSIKCPSCSFELRDNEGSKVVMTFAGELTNKSDSDKFMFIKNFPIPNSREDILEFMILAYTNFDAKEYIKKSNSNTPAKAWYVKMEQCFIKAKMMFSQGDSAFASIKNMYNEIMENIEKEKRISGGKKFNYSPLFWISIFLEVFAVFMTLGSFITGSVISGLFGLVMTSGILVTILIGKNVICVKHSIIKYLVLIVSVLFFIPLVIFLA